MDTHTASQQIKNQLEKLVVEVILDVLEKLTAEIAVMRKSASDQKF